MAMITKVADSEKVRTKLDVCRDAGMNITQNFISGITRVEYDGILVMRCLRKGENVWQVEYNDDFWEEVSVNS